MLASRDAGTAQRSRSTRKRAGLGERLRFRGTDTKDEKANRKQLRGAMIDHFFLPHRSCSFLHMAMVSDTGPRHKSFAPNARKRSNMGEEMGREGEGGIVHRYVAYAYVRPASSTTTTIHHPPTTSLSFSLSHSPKLASSEHKCKTRPYPRAPSP